MDTEPRRDSAVIYPFPAGGRAGVQRDARSKQKAAVTIPSGRGWYHDIAIREETGAPDPKPQP